MLCTAASQHEVAHADSANWNAGANGITIETILINSHYPVGPDSFVLQYGAIVKKVPGLSDEESAGLEQDLESERLEQGLTILRGWSSGVRFEASIVNRQREIVLAADHAAYHVGQLVLVRRALRAVDQDRDQAGRGLDHRRTRCRRRPRR